MNAPQLRDSERIVLLNASAELALIEIIAAHGLSPLALGRVQEALEVVRKALRLERLRSGMELRRAA
jgi:hypothetical protein